MIRLCILVCVLFCFPAMASGIRTVQINNSKMQAINLTMGRATILRFTSKPRKVVIGNQNYYSVEFINNDLTIQPLGKVATNLFVYTPYCTYGFTLRVCQSCRSDDLVFVRWKSNYQWPSKSVKKVTSK